MRMTDRASALKDLIKDDQENILEDTLINTRHYANYSKNRR